MRISSGSPRELVDPRKLESSAGKRERGGRAPLAKASRSTGIGRGVEGRGVVLDVDVDEGPGGMLVLYIYCWCSKEVKPRSERKGG
jgi:hypothetical protein